MERIRKSNLIIILGMLLIGILAFAATNTQPVHAAGDIAGGTYDNVPWRITDEYELIIGKQGQTYVYDYAESRTALSYPWHEYAGELKSASIAGGVYGNGSCNGMFEGCKALESLDIKNFDTSNVTNMGSMFKECEMLTTIDVSHFDTTNVRNMVSMFFGCYSVTELNVKNFDTINVTSMLYMFDGCNALQQLDVSGFDTSNVTNMSAMFGSCNRLESLDVSNFDTSNVDNMNSMFYACESITELDVSGFDTSKVIDMEQLFYDCLAVESLDLSNFDTSNVKKMNSMFTYCRALKSLDLSSFDTSNVSEMYHMFHDCWALESVDLSSFDTSRVLYMNGMFRNCRSLKGVDLSSFDTSYVKEMADMFQNCGALESLDLSGFDTSNVTDMRFMFDGCSSLTVLKTGYGFNEKTSGYSAIFPVKMYDSETGEEYVAGGEIPSIWYRTYVTDQSQITGPVAGKGFRIPEDTNSFGHSRSAFFEGEWRDASSLTAKQKKLYDTVYKSKNLAYYSEKGDRYFIVDRSKDPAGLCCWVPERAYDRLLADVARDKEGELKDARYGMWEGSCNGLAVSIALASQGIKLKENGITTYYHQSAKPRFNRALRTAINYYQLSQYTNKGNDTEATFDNWRLFPDVSDPEVSLDQFLQDFANESLECARQNRPIIFSYGYYNDDEEDGYGHSIVVYDATKTGDEQYSIKMYDPNGQKTITCSVDVGNKTIDFTDGIETQITTEYFTYFSYIGLDRLYGPVAHMNTKSRSVSQPSFRVSLGKKCTVTNDRGEYLTFDGEKYGGTMQVHKVNITGEEAPIVEFEVDPYETLTLTGFDSEMKFTGSIADDYYTTTVKGADTVTLSAGQIRIQGEEYTFSGGTTAGVQNADLYKVSGAANGDVTLTGNEGALSLDAENGVEYAVVSTCGGSSVDYTEATGVTDHIAIDTASEEQEVVIDPVPSGTDINDCIAELSTSAYTYNGTAKTPKVTVKYGVCELTKDTDYTVSYAKNTGAGTASVIIKGKGAYTRTMTEHFTIAKAKNPLTVKPRTATVKYSKLKKKTQTLAVTKVIKFTKKAKDKKTYTLVSAKKGTKSYKKYFKISKTTGKVTIKKNKRMKKGTYKVKVKIQALGNSNYKASAVKSVTFKVKVK